MNTKDLKRIITAVYIIVLALSILLPVYNALSYVEEKVVVEHKVLNGVHEITETHTTYVSASPTPAFMISPLLANNKQSSSLMFSYFTMWGMCLVFFIPFSIRKYLLPAPKLSQIVDPLHKNKVTRFCKRKRLSFLFPVLLIACASITDIIFYQTLQNSLSNLTTDNVNYPNFWLTVIIRILLAVAIIIIAMASNVIARKELNEQLS